MKSLGTLLLTTVLLLLLGGCHMFSAKHEHMSSATHETPQPTRLQVQIYEVPALVLNRFIPANERTAIPNSAYFTTIEHGASASDLLLQGIHSDAGLLFDAAQDLDKGKLTWTINYPTLAGTNAVHGTLGVTVDLGDSLGKHELHIEGKAQHFSRGTTDTPSVESRIAFDSPKPPPAILFIAPFQRPDGTQFAQVIVLTLTGQ